MTTEEIIRTELACVLSDCHNKDNRVCDGCEHALPMEEIVRAYNDVLNNLHNGHIINVLEGRIEKLKEQIERMKCCGNCAHSDSLIEERIDSEGQMTLIKRCGANGRVCGNWKLREGGYIR